MALSTLSISSYPALEIGTYLVLRVECNGSKNLEQKVFRAVFRDLRLSQSSLRKVRVGAYSSVLAD